MMSSPEQIQRDIERTRASLSYDVDRLGQKVAPSQVIGRRVGRVKASATSLRERVMGAPDEGGLRGVGSSVGSGASSAKDAVGSAASTVGDAASSVGEAAAAAPQAVRRQTRGNPLAAGMIAFGVGWLASSLAPASQKERQLARAAEDKASELAEPMKEKAQEVAQNLQEPLQHSAEQVKQAATGAAGDTAEQARSAADEVREPLQS
jgi:hypothetical protein